MLDLFIIVHMSIIRFFFSGERNVKLPHLYPLSAVLTDVTKKNKTKV